MPAGQRPLVRRRLRTELRQERERAGKSQAEVAEEMDWSLSKVIRLEAGQVGISTNDLKALLDLYQIQDAERRTFFVSLARATRQQSAWWAAYRDIAPSTEYLDFLGYENDAASLNYYCTLILPGLLQTEDYAREINIDGGPDSLTDDEVERSVQLRMARKQHVLDQDNPPDLHVILDEAALRRLVGGAEVMNDQLTSIAEVAALTNVVVQVLPFTLGAHAGMRGPFEILEFSDPADAPVLQFDAAPSDVVLRDNPKILSVYRRAFEQLREASMSESESLVLINQIAEEMLADSEE